MASAARTVAGIGTALGLALLPRVSHAGNGPWTLSSGDHALYVGGDWSRWTSYAADGEAGRELEGGVSRSSFLGVWSVGIREGVELELRVPYHTVRVDSFDAPICGASDEMCTTSQGVGRIGGTVKFRLVDEVFRPPLTVALLVGAESGEHTARYRGRLTNLGEGQSDLLAGLSAGRTASVGAGGGWYRAHLTVLYALRAGLEGTGFSALPGDELRGEAAAMVSPAGRLGLGLTVGGYQRLGGKELDAISPGEPNAWAQLATAQVRAGAKFMVQGQGRLPSLTLGLARAVFAQNNPSDELFMSFGLGWFFSAVEDDPFLAE